MNDQTILVDNIARSQFDKFKKISSCRMLINKAHIRIYALHLAKSSGRRFTRVSEDFFQRVNGRLRIMVANEVHRAPSIGVTLK